MKLSVQHLKNVHIDMKAFDELNELLELTDKFIQLRHQPTLAKSNSVAHLESDEKRIEELEA